MPISTVSMILLVCLLPVSANGRSKPKEPAPKDAIDVTGHVAIAGGPVTGLTTTQHYNRTYLYAEHASSQTITVIDVTDGKNPQVISNVPSASGLVTAVGDEALVSSEGQASAPSARTISILDLSDKANPKVAREFKGITSVGRDDAHGLIFLADGEGIWVLHRNPAIDPEVMERYAHDVVYNH